MSTRERVKWDKDEGQNLKIRDKKLKESFLNVFEQVEVFGAKPQDYLRYIFFKLIALSEEEERSFTHLQSFVGNADPINIHVMIEMLQKHFAEKQSSRLPVIAIYSIYEILVDRVSRFYDKKLLPLQVHTSADKHGFGDIEIYTSDNCPFEVVEVKHNIPIDKYLIFDIAKKVQSQPINRYYILTTFDGSFESKESELEVVQYIAEIRQKTGLDIIANGIITSLKYYLRFVDDYREFIDTYTRNLVLDAKNSSEVKNFHILSWQTILEQYFRL